MALEYLGGHPPPDEGKSYARVKLSWLRQRVQMTPGDGAPPDVPRQYARCYIMMMIGGALFPDKTNNIVSLRHNNLEMSAFLPLVISWIYQRFPHFCPPGKDLMAFPLVSRFILLRALFVML
ncbi:hypothetical protein PIB30_100351 [Stylosanthes scabra]|uniref:Aminotransferase-like plant mobile domain-containing protein n=1 Tax=Stylosanthes scabra TaxID=79078 RepID=A0ABU6SXE2_9FABA|nr:hypothetical protein [Stylosanthes scabra]